MKDCPHCGKKIQITLLYGFCEVCNMGLLCDSNLNIISRFYPDHVLPSTQGRFQLEYDLINNKIYLYKNYENILSINRNDVEEITPHNYKLLTKRLLDLMAYL